MSDSELHDFAQFMRWREAAATAYIQGDAAPVLSLTAPQRDVGLGCNAHISISW